MSLSIRETLAVLPSGERFTTALTWSDVGQYLRDNCNRDEDTLREQRHILRDQMYRDGGCEHMCSVIDSVFTHKKVAELRKRWVRHARFANPLKRTVNELSTVYQRPAARTVDGETDQKNYKDLLDDVAMDVQALNFGRMLTLHRAILIGFRVRKHADSSLVPVAYCVTPSSFRPVLDPADDSHVLGWLVRTGYRAVGAVGMAVRDRGDAPAWVLWTSHEQVMLRSDWTIIESSVVEHGFGVSPLVPVTMIPNEPGFWPGEDGEDLVSARVAVWMTNVLMLKETKSATKMPVVTGDTSTAARGDMHDSEGLLEVGEGASFTTIDNSMDLGAYQGVSEHIGDSSGQNYGLAPAQVRNQGVQSAAARDLQRIPLNELRDQQRIPWRKAEYALAVVMSAVCATELPSRAFSVDGWRIDFDEGATPLGQADEQTMYERRVTANLDNPIDYQMRRNPDLTEAGAWSTIERNVTVNTKVQELTRPMNAISGADLGGDPALVAQRKAEIAAADAAELAAKTGTDASHLA